jgi:heptosyltransferase-2
MRNQFSQVLIIGPAWIGDMVLAHSLFKVFRQRHPQSRLDVLAPEWTHPLLSRMSEVDEAIAAPFAHGKFDLSARLKLGRVLRARGYDRAIVLPNSWKSALVPWAARIPRRIGFTGELRYGLLNDMRRLDKAKWPRTVDRFVALGLDAGETLPEIPNPQLNTNTANAHAVLAR